MHVLPETVRSEIITYALPDLFVLRDGLDPDVMFPGNDPEHIYGRVDRTIWEFHNQSTVPFPSDPNDVAAFWEHDVVQSRGDEQWVAWLIAHPQYIRPPFSSNPSEAAVTYLLTYPLVKDRFYWNTNTNPIVIKRLMDGTDPPLVRALCMNASDDVMDWLLRNHWEDIVWEYWALNPSERAVQYLIDHPHVGMHTLSSNPFIYRQVPDVFGRIVWLIELQCPESSLDT